MYSRDTGRGNSREGRGESAQKSGGSGRLQDNGLFDPHSLPFPLRSPYGTLYRTTGCLTTGPGSRSASGSVSSLTIWRGSTPNPPRCPTRPPTVALQENDDS